MQVLERGDKVRASLAALDSETRAAQLTGIGTKAKKYIVRWTKDIYTVSKINYSNSVRIYKIMDSEGKVLDTNFYSTDLQKVDPAAVVPSHQTEETGPTFLRAKHLKKIHVLKKQTPKPLRDIKSNLSERTSRQVKPPSRLVF